jgi:hypothetical protein
MSQADRILEHLQKGLPLTPVDALRWYGCFRLAARIAELKKAGNDIRTATHPDGYAVYFMAPPPPPREDENQLAWGWGK